MRKIKFRGKRIDNGEWIYGNLIKNINEDTDEVRFFIIRNPRLTKDCGCCDSCECDYNCVGYIIEIKEETVGELTGLKDCIGKEIYEGDIVRVDNDWDKYGMTAGESYEIYFNEGGFRLKAKYNKNARGYWLEDNNEFEIIGNIFENKNLLK